MKLTKHYEHLGVYINYRISIGGYVQIMWRTPEERRARMLLRLSERMNPTAKLQLHTNNNALMVVTWTAVKFLMESRRHRYPYEDLDAYLKRTWRLVLEELATPAAMRAGDTVAMTAKRLAASGVLDKMRLRKGVGYGGR